MVKRTDAESHTVSDQRVRRKSFEYRYEKGNRLDRLNELGSEGWEAVSYDGGFFLFKREN